MFNETSPIVKIWVDNIRKGNKLITDVPALGNLKTVVEAELAKPAPVSETAPTV
ncbi:MAG: hypothetical protein RR420_01505 [Anaerovoracaceae bacterium]